MPFRIHTLVGSRTVRETVDGESLRIGRGAGCDLRFDDAAVALDHAVVRRERGGYQVMDLGSVTGTYLNGEPVSNAPVRDGDEIGIGGFVLRARWPAPEEPLTLEVRAADAEPRPGAAALATPAVDYGRSYRLRRGPLNKGMAALGLALLTGAAVAAVPAARRLDLFRPGDLASFHADRIEAAACSDCHRPWRGVADERCQACHGEGRMDFAPPHHPELLARSGGAGGRLAAAPCTACHREHLGRDELTPAGDGVCVECHRDLDLAAGAGAEPAFAARVPAFAEHPEIRLTLPAADGAGLRGSGLRRLPVTDPEARRSDRTALKLDHAKHLAPGLASPEGRVRLACTDCHRVAGREVLPISFEAHCERCHRLTFDDRYPDRAAPHEPPEAVASYLFRVYLEEGRAPGPIREDLIRSLVRSGRGGAAPERAATAEVRRAELRLYQSHCATCHALDLGAAPRPAVAPPGIPERWLPHAAFSHGDHALPGLDCGHCHALAAASTQTADVLLPEIAACVPCHAAGATPGATAAGGFPVAPGPTGCRTCHGYHTGTELGGPAGAGVAP